MALKYSRQREAIKEFMMSRTDHPTADVVYMNVRKEIPNISLGTVYRNITPHYHFVCQKCGSVHDLNLPVVESFNETASGQCDGQIEGHVAYFYGKCKDCLAADAN